MKKSLLLGAILLALALAIPGAICMKQLPGPPWPEPKWIPMSPEEARPKLPDGSPMRLIKSWKGGTLLEGEAFYLLTGWGIEPMNVAWDAETGDPVVPIEDIQDRTGSATAIYEVTMNGEPLGQPTYSYTGICKWFRFYNSASPGETPPFPLGDWAVAPLFKQEERYYVFPNGLPAGEYILHTRMIFPGIGEWEATLTLTVLASTTSG